MDEALVINRTTHSSQLMSADAFQAVYGAAVRADTFIVSPELSVPMRFYPEVNAENKRQISAYFKRAVGYGISGHAITPGCTSEDNFQSALDSGKLILMSLDDSLVVNPKGAGRPVAYDTGSRLDFLLKHEKEYFPVKVKTLQDVLSVIRMVDTHKETLDPFKRLYVACGEEVVSFNRFYLGNDLRKFKAVYSQLSQDKKGLFRKGNRAYGVPSLVELKFTADTVKRGGAGQVFANYRHFDVPGYPEIKRMFSLAAGKALKATPEFQDLVTRGGRSYALVQPFADCDQEGQKTKEWNVIALALKDVRTQTAPIDAQERLLKKRSRPRHIVHDQGGQAALDLGIIK